MKFIECEKLQGTGYCTDNDCPCTLTPIPRGEGYIYISREVVEFRKDAPGLGELNIKLEKITKEGEYISVSRYAPILICETAAKKRGLDLDEASKDAQLFWKEGIVPLRPTPLKSDCENSIKNKSNSDNQLLDNSKHDLESVQSLNSGSDDIRENQKISESLSSLNTGDSKEEDPSLDDVVAQFSSGPLAEFAHKMADNLQNETDDEKPVSDESSSGAIVSSGIEREELNGFDEDSESHIKFENPYEEKTKILKQKKTPDKKGKVPQKSKIPVFVSIVIILLLLVCTIMAFFYAFYNKGQDIVVETKQEVPEPVKINVLEKKFFLKKYQFEDALYKGIISFKLPDNHNYGRYKQSVQTKDSDKTFSVNGSFTFSENTITFRPDSYSKDIVWKLQEYDISENRAVFYDPSEKNREAARIYLNKTE